VTAESFTVSTRWSGRRRTVRVVVYDDIADLRRAAVRHRHRVEGVLEPDHFAEALAVAHSYEWVRGDDDGEVRTPIAGTIRYWRQRLGTSVVVHEVVHIAVGIYRQDWAPEHGAVDDDIGNEEVFCHLVDDLTRRIVDRLYARGFYAAA
jgi:hypothetical protein